MGDRVIVEGQVLEGEWLTLEQVASACGVGPEWLLRHIEEGFLPQARSTAGVWRLTDATLLRARRMRQAERDFDAVPEMAALVADLLDEVDTLRARLRRAGLD